MPAPVVMFRCFQDFVTVDECAVVVKARRSIYGITSLILRYSLRLAGASLLFTFA